MSLPSGTHLGPYEIVGQIGAGGMGEVYRAKDTRIGREVAIKVLPPSFASDPEHLKRFEQEARAISTLNHPNILILHDLGVHEGSPYMVMELLEGQTLRELLHGDALPMQRAVELALQIAQGLAAAHARGLVHRDLKPANLFITRDGHLKILDFGLAKQLPSPDAGPQSQLPTQDAHSLTSEGLVLGTMGYMSPEQVRGQHVDPRSDLFSFGAVLFEMLSGQAAFRRDSAVDTMSAILHDDPGDFGKSPVPAKLKEIVHKLLEKDPAERYASAEEVGADLKELEGSLASRWAPRLSRGAWIAAAAGIMSVAALGGWLIFRERRARWARQELLPRAERLLGEATLPSDLQRVFALAVEAEKIVPGDPLLSSLLKNVAATTTITSEPPGASVSIRPYDDPKAPWEGLGVTPIQSKRLPGAFFLFRFEKAGYEPILAAAQSFTYDWATRERKPSLIQRVLDPVGSMPPGMVRVSGQKDLPDYFIDATEVTNQAYKAFVDAGGYRTREHWKDLLASADGAKGWPGALASLIDATGWPGPATWQTGDYPAGQDKYPVSGVSWYEAAAFAAWAGKELPTIRHWWRAFGAVPATLTATMSNFQGKGTVPVGEFPSISAFGARDMAGNVREWCWNEASGGRVLRGGAWNDVPYMIFNLSRAAPLDRSPMNGFRCAKILDREKVPTSAFSPFKPDSGLPDFHKVRPVSDAVFRAYRDQFAYDRSELGATIEWRNTAARDWVQEKVNFNAAYDSERMTAYLFLPNRGAPPYQTVVYFPGSGSALARSSKDLDTHWEFEQRLAHYLKAGRAVVYPVYKGTFERGSDAMSSYHIGAPTHQYTELLIKMVKDFRRTLDYLETRPDLDHDRVAFLGFSWGGMYGAIIPAVEERLRASMLVVGGIWSGPLPEADQINFVGRVKIPTLMLNGRYDFTYPYESSAKPLYDLLGTPLGKKRQVIYETDHGVPHNAMVKETLAWLDKYLGPVP